MSQNWLSSNLWPKTTNVASVASNGVSDLKSAKTDTSGTFQSLLAGKLSDKTQSSSKTSKLNNTLGEMRASKKLDPPAIKGNPKSLDQVEVKPKSTDAVTAKEVERSETTTSQKKETKITESNVQENEKMADQDSVEQTDIKAEELVKETAAELNVLMQYLTAEVPNMPELETAVKELVTQLDNLSETLTQTVKPEVLLKQMKEVLEAVKSLQSLSATTETNLPAPIKATLDQLAKTIETTSVSSVENESFASILKDLSSAVKENSKSVTLGSESAKQTTYESTTSSESVAIDSTKSVTGDVKEQKHSSTNQGSDTEANKQKFSEVVKINQENKQSADVKSSGHNFVSEMNAKVESSSISFGKTDTTIGKTSLQQNILDQIINSPRMQVKQTELGTIMTMKLNPEVLGNVEIKLEIIKNVLQAEINVENMIVKGAIESNLSDLKNALSDKGYQVENLNVSVNKDGQDQRGQQQRQNEQAQRYIFDEEETSGAKTFKMTSLNEEGTIDYLG